MSHRYWANQYPYLGTWTRTWEPGPVLGNLDLHRSLVRDPYSGTWTRTREPVLVYVLKSWPNIDGTYGTTWTVKFVSNLVQIWQKR